MEDYIENIRNLHLDIIDLLCIAGAIFSTVIFLVMCSRVVICSDDPYSEFDRFVDCNGDRKYNGDFAKFSSIRKILYMFYALLALASAALFYFFLIIDIL